MDAASLAVRLGHRRHRLSDALSAVLIAVVLVSPLAIPVVHAQASTVSSAEATTVLPGIPLATPVTIHPRLISAYAALLAAAMLSLLYLYRGRSFVVYWIGSWLLVAAGLGIVARSYSDPTLGSVLTGLALLFTVSSAGLMRLSVESFPHHPVRWDGRRITAMSAAALWFLGIFILYQLYRFSHTHSLGLLVLSAFDLFVASLVWREYRAQKHHADNAR